MKNKLYSYESTSNPRLDREQLKNKTFLRRDHFDRLSRSSKGVLRDLTIATANLHSTYDVDEILDIYTDGDRSKKENFGCVSMAKRIAHTGAMVIPYPEYGLSDIGARNWRRVRTDFVTGKYLSPLGQYSPPYRVLGMDHPDFIKLFREQITKEALSETNKESNPLNLQIAQIALSSTQLDDLNNAYKNPKIPLLVVEGEFKALAIQDALLDAHKDCIKHLLTAPDRDFAQLELASRNMLPPLFTCAGIGGVWNMVTKGQTPAGQPTKYVVRPEWKNNINLKDREILICFDSDSKWITQVAHAASCLAQACKEDFNAKVSYISIPSPRGLKYGADDYIEAFGPKAFLDLIPQAKPLAAGIPFNTIADATREGKPPVDFLIELEQERLSKKQQITR